MFFNYLKSAFRNLKKNTLFSSINILGLAVGITACLLILHYIKFEQSYDKFHADTDRIYRLRYERTSSEGKTVRFASCCPPAAPLIREQFSNVEKIAKIFRYRASVSFGDIMFPEERMYFMEPEFFEIFEFPFLEGNPVDGLKEPNKAYVSESTARKYFGDLSPIGKVLSVDKKDDYQIIGTFKDTPENSHLKFDIVLPWKNLAAKYGPSYEEAWGHTGAYTYLRLQQGTTPADLKQGFADLVTANCPWLVDYKMTIDLVFQPVTDIHLTSHYMQEYEANGNNETIKYLYIIALIIIVIAWVNYINLSTSQSLTRAREVGLRKVIGATKSQLLIQFLLETVLINIFAVVLALGAIKLLNPLFCNLTGLPVSWPLWSQTWFFPYLALFFLAGVLFSGIYPVIVMTSFEPIKTLKGFSGKAGCKFNLRKALVIFQFIMAFVLITGTLTISQQIAFMKKQDLGFNMEQVVVIKAPRVRDDNFNNKLETFKQELLRQTDIKKFCVCTEVPGRQIYWDNGGIFIKGQDVSQGKNYQIVGIDYDYIDFFDLKLAGGRNFSKEFATDKDALIFNETAVKWIGFENKEQALNKEISYWGKTYTLIGVLKDFHQQSLKQAFEPHIYRFLPGGRDVRGQFAVKVGTADIQNTIKTLEQNYKKFFPGNPFDFFFLDDYYNQQYQADELLGQVVGLFSFLALFVTGLGIFGLASFMASRRIKEIGIRKVLGADVSGILFLLSKEFILLMSLSFIISIPLSYLAIKQWLNTFAFPMHINPWLFIIPLLVIAFITLLTVNSRSLKAATTNPVETLRYE